MARPCLGTCPFLTARPCRRLALLLGWARLRTRKLHRKLCSTAQRQTVMRPKARMYQVLAHRSELMATSRLLAAHTRHSVAQGEEMRKCINQFVFLQACLCDRLSEELLLRVCFLIHHSLRCPNGLS